MPRIHPNDWDFGEEYELKPRRQKKTQLPKRLPDEVVGSLVEEVHTETGFHFTYQASRHEREWIVNSLNGFYDQKWIEDVLRVVKGGKEASVYQCTGGLSLETGFLAAKVYRPRRYRQMKNDTIYREGRQHLDSDGNTIHDGGRLHAIHKRTSFGRQLIQASWIEHEYKTMQILHAAGVDSPEPYACGDNAILMEYIGEPDAPAHTLNEIALPYKEAKDLFQRVLRNVDLMLSLNRVHGDLSAYNILYQSGEIYLIDFPQAIQPMDNRSAYEIFVRDITRVCDYFSRQGVAAQPLRIARELWTRYNFPIDPQIHPKDLDDQDDSDRVYWEKFGRGV